MATNNAYNRSFKTKREQYEEKLKQRNENENWIFGNTFGRPGGGAPLRDRNGNVVSNLKSITNDNIYKYEAQDFSKGDNNITVVNHKIYERNNGDVSNVISDPFTPFRNYINQFESNQNNQSNKANISINNNNIIQNINTINPNQIVISQDQLNNLNYQNIMNNQNNQMNNEEQKKELYLNQFKQNPYLIQAPYGFVTQYPIVHPFIPLYTSQMQNQNPNIVQNNTNNNLLMNNYNNQIEYQRPYTTNNENASNNVINENDANNTTNSNINNINNNVNNYSNVNNINNNYNYNYITGDNNGRRKYIRKLPESTLFSDVDQEKTKLEEKEKKMDEWKKELLVQINEKKKREAEEKRRMKENEKKDELNNEKYLKFKKKQKEEQQKMHMKQVNKQLQNEVDGSGSMGNILDISNDLEQVNKSMHSQNNLLLKDIANNDFSQNNIQIQDNLNNNNNNNFSNNNFSNNNNNNFYSNNFNPLQQSQEEQNFKSYIDRQYHMLNETLNNDINNEMKRIEEEVENNYTPFTKKFLLMNTFSKTTAELSMENEKKLKKIQDLIDERKLVDYILGQRERPPTPKKENEELEKVDLPVPSYFGINRDKPENKYLGLHSKSSFITKNENIANFIASGRNQNQNLDNILTTDLVEKEEINDNYNKLMNGELDVNSNFKSKSDTRKATFGTNIRNDEALGGSINLAKNLDNISTFIPLNKNRENINLTNEQKMKFIPGLNSDFGKFKDKDMEDLFKDLDKIYELTNKIDVTSKARNISDKFENDLNRKINLNKEQLDNISLNSKNNLNNIEPEKISEEKSYISSNNKDGTNSKNSKSSQKKLTNGTKSKNSKNSENNLTNGKLSENSNNANNNLNNENINENENLNDENVNENLNEKNENGTNNEIISNEEKNSSSQNEKEEKEQNNIQNINEEPNQNENIEENQNNVNNANNINEPENIQNNNVNDNQNKEEDGEEYEEVEEDEEVEQ